MMDVTALSSLLTVLLVVTEPQILTDRIMRVIDLLAATAGLEVDLDADIVDRYSLQAETDNLGIAGIFLIKVSEKLNLQFFHGRSGAKLIQNLIFEAAGSYPQYRRFLHRTHNRLRGSQCG